MMLSRSLKGHGYSRAVSEGNIPALAAGKDGLERLVKNKGKLRQRTSGLNLSGFSSVNSVLLCG